MPDRDVSPAALKGMLAQQTDQVYLELLTLTHPSLVAPIYLVNNTESVTSGGHTFEPWPFQMQLPDDDGAQIPQVTLVADMVDQSVGLAIQALKYPMPGAKYQVVLADTPDTVEAGPYKFDAISVTYDQGILSASLSYEEDFLNEPFPGTQCTPNNNPGQFG